MDQPDREAEPQFSQPIRQIVLMLIALGLTATGAVFAAPSVMPVFEANPYLNGFIAMVFIFGVLACFWQVAQLISSVRWIEAFAQDSGANNDRKAPQLLAPLATLLRARARRMQISSTSATSILESVATRIDEAREITRYIVNLLIFLGLLGTFYGLATTVPAVVDTIRSLAPQEGEGGVEVFNRLMTGLEAQLGGMGVAFASSLLGLAGSLVVGLLELFAGHGQNRFYRELEEWMSTITRVGFAAGDAEVAPEQAAMAGVVDQLAEQMAVQMDNLHHMLAQSNANRDGVDARLTGLADAIDRLTDRMPAPVQGGDMAPVNDALLRVAEGQEALLARLTQSGESEGLDAESRMRLRSIDVQMLRILEEISAGRHETMAELRTDIAALSRVISQTQRTQAQARPAPVRKPTDG
ncbi:biopolymer transporter ExbB [Pseudooceanicola aestuarii]|uniref:biopolymer transporter ExbB n=1 Tax=Pseudooceanicola aestuarii TaxID=2697319 RepID=UPI0013D16A9D|nr:biopolymer transporter ExbB [Pseudooceanicola aestuarii]